MSNERVSVDAYALNALCEAASKFPTVHHLVLAARNSVVAIEDAPTPVPEPVAESEMEYGENYEPDDADPNS